jgi:hypothetical protein
MVLSNREELIIKKWLEWNSQAAKTNAISSLMEARQKELGANVTAEQLKQDSVYNELKISHDINAELCDKPFKEFKTLVKNYEAD